MKQAYVLCAMLFSAVSLKTAIENQYFYTTNNIGTSTRGVLSTVSERARGGAGGGGTNVAEM